MTAKLAMSLLLAFPTAAWAQSAPGGAADAPRQVGVVSMKSQEVPRILTLPGRAIAYEQVDVRPRVDGVITKILYTYGQKLNVGDPLFQLDDASYQATVASDEADLAKAKANLPVAQSEYNRAKKLEGTGYTKAEVESAWADLAEAKATLDAAKSELVYSKTQLSWTTIRSPIQGFAEVADVSVGDLVTSAQSDALTTITRLDPIYVDVTETTSRVLLMRQLIESGKLQPREGLKAELTLENGEIYKGTGTLVTPSRTVSTTTGTITIRFRFNNPDQKILPGMFLRAAVDLGTIKAFLVPQRASERGADGTLSVFIVDKDSKSKAVTLTSIGTSGNNWIVTAGLSDGDQVLVDGLKTMRAGLALKPVAASIDGEGLVKDSSASTPSGTNGTAD